MDEVLLRLKSGGRASVLVEQGIPLPAFDREQVDSLRLIDERGRVIPAAIEPDGRDEHGNVTWVRVATCIKRGPDADRLLRLASVADRPNPLPKLCVRVASSATEVSNSHYRLLLSDPGNILLSTECGELLSGDVRFHLWPDARSIVGGGAGTCRLAGFRAEGWSVEEESPGRCLVVLKGCVPKFAPYASDPAQLDPEERFLCELELACYAFSPIIRYRWRIENHTRWQAFLERYVLSLPLAPGSARPRGQQSGDGKCLRYASIRCPGGALGFVARFVDALGPGAGINFERRSDLIDASYEEISRFAGGRCFEPHRWLAADADDGSGLDIVSGGVNPPHDGRMTAGVPEVHRLFYAGMGRTFAGSIVVRPRPGDVASELNRAYFGLPPDYYSRTGALPENGDPVCFGDLKESVFASAEWLLRSQWRGTLWWGEWWREYDTLRDQGVESTANGNNALAPLYHYWRTGDDRFVDCAQRAMEFAYDVQLCKRPTKLGPFFHSRRFLMDGMEWVHMRYQRIEGIIKTAHFFGDRRIRTKTIEAMKSYARKLVYPNGAPGYGWGGPDGQRSPAGLDCANFAEVLTIIWRETGETEFLDMAVKMARWAVRTAERRDWRADPGNSYGWHFPMRGALAVVKAAGDRRVRRWFVDTAMRNMRMKDSRIGFVHWMNWLVVEAEKLSGESWMLDVLLKNTLNALDKQTPDGAIRRSMGPPWSKWPTQWDYIYDAKALVAYAPVLTARRQALSMSGGGER